jgi:hypothetical protein
MVSLAISGRPSAGASALASVVLPLAGGPDTTTYLPGGHRSVTRLLSRPDGLGRLQLRRFIGGGLAPYAAGRLVLAAGIHVPFFIAVGVILLGIGILGTAHSLLGEAERVQAQQVTAPAEEPAAGALIPVPAGITTPRARRTAGCRPSWTPVRAGNSGGTRSATC